MYNYNTVDGKLDRINHLKDLISKISEIPGDHLSYLDARAISQYLIDIQKDLEHQIAPEIAKRNKIKRYRYHYLAEDIVIMADSGAEADREYKKLRKDPPAGDIELTDMVTGEVDMIMKLDLGEAV